MIRPGPVLLLLFALGCENHKGNDSEEGEITVDPLVTSETEEDCTQAPDPIGDPEAVDLAGECPLDQFFGGFLVAANDMYSIVDGSVADGVVPVTILTETNAAGDCVMKRRDNPFCDPACQPGETCDFDGSCIPFPENKDLGIVTVGGLVVPVNMEPVQPGNSYFDSDLPHPAMIVGGLIELKSCGENFFGESFNLHGVGVEPMSLAGDLEWTLFDDQDLTIDWVAPAGSVRSHVHLRLNIDQHGNTPIQLYCEFDDDGSGTVPATLITDLIGSGVTGFPNATVTRRTVDSQPIGEGCMEFIITSSDNPDTILVDGYVPCFTDEDCPPPTTCNELIQLCV